ncbi:type II toxin-antitoxin system death-on-curing family toxin [Clostridium sp. D5]|uniref:type II toxin-antitoxin system death-on-curing family toxin n=1 Tax=Clostridium sp. D5 TaxID=556261 RepID=UPI0001FC8257|nr:toxin-antitoxin system, toxin component, Fic family [Clostridium sp. D5]
MGLVNNHAFNDVNKRIGVLAMLTPMELNGMEVEYTVDELVDLGLSIASGKSGQSKVLDWIKQHS